MISGYWSKPEIAFFPDNLTLLLVYSLNLIRFMMPAYFLAYSLMFNVNAYSLQLMFWCDCGRVDIFPKMLKWRKDRDGSGIAIKRMISGQDRVLSRRFGLGCVALTIRTPLRGRHAQFTWQSERATLTLAWRNWFLSFTDVPVKMLHQKRWQGP